MKALICRGFGEGENLALEGRPLPQPGPGQVRVKVLACGANASDWEMITGRPAYGRISRWFLRGRDVFGSDIIGRVEALGPGCTRLQTGQRVAADTFGSFGGFASYAVAAEKLFVPVPNGVSDILAAALPQSGTIALTAMRGRVTPGMKVLVNGGGGGSGSLAIQLAVAEGAEVWGVDTGAKADVMIEAGASRVFDFEQEDWAESGAEFDLILDLWGTRPMRVTCSVSAWKWAISVSARSRIERICSRVKVSRVSRWRSLPPESNWLTMIGSVPMISTSTNSPTGRSVSTNTLQSISGASQA
ncbi:MAG: zinc-binding alcohol dehydrogenase family protein, partial [Maritimibacter sp.]